MLLWCQGRVLSPPLARFDFHHLWMRRGMQTELLSNVMTKLVMRRVFKVLRKGSVQSELQANARALPNHLHLNPAFRVPVYLVATHVVTLVHDHRFATFVVLSNIQAGF